MSYLIRIIRGLLGGLLLLSSVQAQQTLPGVAVQAQADEDTAQSTRLKIINADFLTFQKRDDLPVQKLIGRVQMQQDSTYFFCDSAYLYDNENRAEAFGRVRVEMSDSVFLFADRMEYEGETRIAEVFNNITLTDQQSVLTTDRLTYYRNEEYGYYQEGGTLEDGESTLKSIFGYYYPNQDRATFRKDVTLVHPDYTLSTDTLDYNTEIKVAHFVTQTFIDSKDGKIETSRGNYDTENSRVNLYARSIVRDSSYTLTADTLYYIDKDNLGLAFGDVRVLQEDSTLEIRGQFGRFNRETDESMLTGEAVAIQKFDEDTLYIFADTLFATKETRYVYAPPVPDTTLSDSIGVSTDSLASAIGEGEIPLDSLSAASDSVQASLQMLSADSVLLEGNRVDSLHEEIALAETPEGSM
ncbi:MAG: OstA-like protein, partial [Bacteroidota bacterium]